MKDYAFKYGELKGASEFLARTAKESVEYNPKFQDGTGVYEKLLMTQANRILDLLENHETPNR